MKPLSDEILSTAFTAQNGEHGWHLEEIESVLKAIAGSGQATIGGHAWFVESGEIIEFLPNETRMKIWDVAHQAPEESWTDYCHRALDESLREIETSKFEEVVPIQSRDCFYINPTYVEEFDIRSLVPRNKHDYERAAAAIAAGYPVVAPILPELLEWLQDIELAGCARSGTIPGRYWKTTNSPHSKDIRI